MRATDIARALSARAEEVARHLLPNGTRKGPDWCCSDLSGAPGSSLKIRVSGAKAGVWADFGSNEKGDMIGLWRAVRGVELAAACKEASEYLGIHDLPVARQKPASDRWLKAQAGMSSGYPEDIEDLVSLRRLPNSDGLQAAIAAKALHFGPVNDGAADAHCWLITDSSRRAGQARRMDGQPFADIHAKAKTIKGCDAGWPVGIADAGAKDIALTEGGPDHLAAWTMLAMSGQLDSVHPVTMLGSSQVIPADALELFASKTILIFPHADDNDAGATGAFRWARQLRQAGCRIGVFDFKQHGVKDLNELLSPPKPEEVEL